MADKGGGYKGSGMNRGGSVLNRFATVKGGQVPAGKSSTKAPVKKGGKKRK